MSGASHVERRTAPHLTAPHLTVVTVAEAVAWYGRTLGFTVNVIDPGDDPPYVWRDRT